ncbi:MAG: asparagine synthase (glutamine-hydrolyzing) [Bdellovibrionales bacterium]
MCGIAGFWDSGAQIGTQEGKARLTRMCDRLAHRGPDGAGEWDDAQSGVFLGHRRLSILDLSAAGTQPMRSHNDRYVLVFNGEIYNFDALRKNLPDTIAWRGHSDTEILLEHIAHCGLDETLRRAKGMFAFALWDRKDKILTLARDHIGKKPLYAGWVEGCFVFASELKAIEAFASNKLPIDQAAFTAYQYFGFVPTPQSIYKDICKIHPGSILHLLADDVSHNKRPDIASTMKRYWKPEKGSFLKKEIDINYLIKDAVALRMVSDVPLGVFLSGGIDSSLVASMMQEQSMTPIKSYAIAFSDHAFDESHHAEKIAAHLGTDHTTYRVDEGEALRVIPDLPRIYDEPFADYSQIPSVVLCAQARKDTVVALSGDGGDEVFCGYKRYFMLHRLLQATRFMPRKAISAALRSVEQGTYNRLGLNGKRLHSIAGFLSETDLEGAILRTLSVNPAMPRPPLDLSLSNDLSPFERMMMIDTQFYLPDDILVKIDRASMAASLEVRSPLLDKDVIEAAWSLPIDDKIFAGQGRGKKPLYDLLARYVPETLINRPKQGFTPPIAAWLRGTLRPWAEDLIHTDTGLYDQQDIAALWQDFITGRADHHTALWGILMAQSWALHNKQTFAKNIA